MLIPKKIVFAQMRWVLGSAVACVVALAALTFYFSTRNRASSPAEVNQITSSEKRRNSFTSRGEGVRTGSEGERGQEGPSETSAVSKRPNESPGPQGKAFYEFSGITTIDPDSHSAIPLSQNSPEPKGEPKDEPKTALPVVFQPVDPNLLKLTPVQQEVIDQLKQSFMDMMSGAPQDPKDPKYLEQWKEAQPQIDQQLKAQLGGEFFRRYESAIMKQTKK